MMGFRCAIAGTLIVLGLHGCSLGKPSSPASQLREPSSMSVQEVAGVRLTVAGNAWNAYPPDLNARVTPVEVTIQNRSGSPILIRYRDVALVGASRQPYPALPPISLEPHRSLPIFTPAYSSLGFQVAPYYAPYYPTIMAWDEAFPTDHDYHRRHFPSWPTPLPSHDMLAHALPEGVLENNGNVTGFVYFKKVNGESRVGFLAHLVASPRGTALATADIPVNVR